MTIACICRRNEVTESEREARCAGNSRHVTLITCAWWSHYNRMAGV